MEVSAKLKELEEEFKVLKAEIRNVLLDIRETILDRTNPLGEEHESAHLTLDLNTTARAMAAEAASHEATKAVEAAAHEAVEAPHHEAERHRVAVPATDDSDGHDPAASGGDAVANEPEAAASPEGVNDDGDEAPPPKVVRRKPSAEVPAYSPKEELPTEIPVMYQANIPPLNGNVNVSSWLTQALETVGPHELERIITIHRLWGNLPPNISRALAYLQELLQTTEEDDPPWLKVMQELDALAAL